MFAWLVIAYPDAMTEAQAMSALTRKYGYRPDTTMIPVCAVANETATA